MKKRKITLTVEDDGRQFQAFKGRELIAFTRDGYLYIKTESCNLCGECCMDEPNTAYGIDDEGKCNKLVRFGDTWECSAGNAAPFNCLGDPNEGDYPNCSIKYSKVKV